MQADWFSGGVNLVVVDWFGAPWRGRATQSSSREEEPYDKA